MTDRDPRLSGLSREQRQRLLEKLQSKAAGKAQVIPRRGPSAQAPLSFAQQRLWFLHALDPGGLAYNIFKAIQISGPLDITALEQGLNEIVRRHETLRTTFLAVEGQPTQLIHPAQPLPLPLLDLQSLPAPDRAAEARRHARAEAHQPFDLAAGPLVRFTLLRLAPDEHIALLTMHHVISDGWSVGLFIREITALYAAVSAGTPAPLPEPPVQYADFAIWQREWLQSQDDQGRSPLQTQLAFWRRQLADMATLQLPTDHPRPPAQSFRGAAQHLACPAPLLDQLNALSRQEGVTLFITLLAAFKLLLARYSRQSDIVVGSPVAGRTHRETEGLIGFFVNTLVLRTDLAGDPTFRELLGRVRAVVADAQAHQDLPFERLVDELQPARDPSRNPLFQVMCTFQRPPIETTELAGLTFTDLEIETETSGFDLTLSFTWAGPQLTAKIDYNTDLFDAATIARIAGHYQALLAAVAADPDRRISALPLHNDAERHKLLVEWNATQVGYPLDRCLHQLVGAQAARTPDAVALLFDRREPRTKNQEPRTKNQEPRTKNQEPSGEDSGSQFSVLGSGQGSQFSILNSQFSYVTYAELNRRANQLAHHLRRLGVGPDVPVGICMERSAELVIALLAVLKAGGAYLPLDPGYPAERLRLMLEDAQVAVLLTQRGRGGEGETAQADPLPLSPSPPLSLSPSVIDLDADWPAIAQEPTDDPQSDATADNLAYVIYTSGSTGKPKGAMNTHRAIVNRLLWMQDAYHLAQTDRVLQKTPYSFDVSVWEFFWPLISGATLVLARPGGHQEPGYLVDLIRSVQITTLHFVPSMLQVFLEQPDLGACQSLRRVVCSGEALSPQLQERFFARFGSLGTELHNLYGPTEAAVDVTHWACAPGDAHTVPIGRPVANTQLYILDDHMRPAPLGVAGELYISGIQLARGYLRRPDLTAERFVPNPFLRMEDGGWRMEDGRSPSSILHPPSSRLYKTGDLCRYREDGAIEFLGRLDHQVKLRGFRIELGEIEAVVRQHGAVREAVVVAREDRPGDKRLVAYVVPRDWRLEIGDLGGDNLQSPISNLPQDLRQFLQDRLPDYMIPAAFVTLDGLPLTPSGKLDRRALPAPSGARPGLRRPYVAPRTPVEAQLAQVWRELLAVEQVGVEDSFFELGGHSLLLMQLSTRMRATFGVELPLRVLFDAPTIAAMTVAIATRQVEQEHPDDIAAMLQELKGLSSDEIQALLEAERISPTQH